MTLTEIIGDSECQCGYGPGPTCHPECPGYREPDPTKVKGVVSLDHAVRLATPERSGYSSWILTGTESPFLALPYDERRYCFTVGCTGTGPMFIGSQKNVMSVASGAATGVIAGLRLTSGSTYTLRNMDELWAVPDGTHPVNLVLAVSRWA
jgi:hypothetical protein